MTQFTVIDTADRDAWFKARESVLTATDIARLYCGGPAEWGSVRREKQGERKEFDSKYMAWGREREQTITDYVRMFVDSSLEPNDKLLVSTADPRIGATPDMIGPEVCGEMKTSKHPMPDMSPGLSLTGIALRYYIQVQVQIMVTGANACVFAWEQHDDDWPAPSPLDIRHQIIRPDKEAFKAIREIVERFHNEPGTDTAEVARFVHELRKLDYERRQIETREKEVKDILRRLVGEGDKIVTPDGSVSVSKPTTRMSFDTGRFKKANPDRYAEYMTEKQVAPSMRVTFTKEDDD